MRAHEFITESNKPEISLDNAYVIPTLKNNDAYLQLRYGVAISDARGQDADEFRRETEFGENQIVIGYGEDVGPLINRALKKMGMSGKRKIAKTAKPADKKAGLMHQNPGFESK